MSEPAIENLQVMTLSEAANFLRVSEKTLGEMARQNRIPCQKAGREWRFLKQTLQEWLSGGGKNQPAIQDKKTSIENTSPTPKAKQIELFQESGFRDTAFGQNREEPLHRWTPWIAGFSADFVDGVLASLVSSPPSEVTILDPFAGVGTTLVEGIKKGFNVVGYEINPYAALASRVKLNSFRYDPTRLQGSLKKFERFMSKKALNNGSPSSVPPQGFRSQAPFFSPNIERQVLLVLDFIADQEEAWVRDIYKLALGSVMVGFSNYSYEPSLGRRTSAGKENILDADVPAILAKKLIAMAADISLVKKRYADLGYEPGVEIFAETYLEGAKKLAPHQIDILITSPPYLNNYHYVRNTRPQLYWLGLVESPESLKKLETTSFGKFWQTVRGSKKIELQVECPELSGILERLRQTNSDRGAYGGFGWANYAATYFNDCARFFEVTAQAMKKGGSAVIVIGNNILQGIEFKTDYFLAVIAEQYGFEVVNLHRVRTKRTGSSIVNSSVRVGENNARAELYETAVELRAG